MGSQRGAFEAVLAEAQSILRSTFSIEARRAADPRCHIRRRWSFHGQGEGLGEGGDAERRGGWRSAGYHWTQEGRCCTKSVLVAFLAHGCQIVRSLVLSSPLTAFEDVYPTICAGLNVHRTRRIDAHS